MQIQIALGVPYLYFSPDRIKNGFYHLQYFFITRRRRNFISRMNSVKHYYLHDDKSGNDALYQGFRWLKQHSANTGALPALGNLQRYTSLQPLEGLKALIKPPNRAIIEGIVYELILPSKMLRHGINRPI
jgi:hypothetical protein